MNVGLENGMVWYGTVWYGMVTSGTQIDLASPLVQTLDLCLTIGSTGGRSTTTTITTNTTTCGTRSLIPLTLDFVIPPQGPKYSRLLGRLFAATCLLVTRCLTTPGPSPQPPAPALLYYPFHFDLSAKFYASRLLNILKQGFFFIRTLIYMICMIL